jgi:Gas vesicle synthesis protein GvpL/GvpF
MALEVPAEPAQVVGHRDGPTDYVYAIVEGLPRRWRPPADGVDAAPVVAREVRGLVLIASAVDTIPRRTPRSVARHDEVISTTLGAQAVIALEFGTVVPAIDVDAWLGAHLGLIRVHLSRLRRQVEMTIRLVSLNPSAEPRRALGAIAERLVAQAGVTHWRHRHQDPAGLSSSLAFLVPRDGVGDFLARVAPVAARAADVAVVPTGPWPPSSFSPHLPVPGSTVTRPGLARAG